MGSWQRCVKKHSGMQARATERVTAFWGISYLPCSSINDDGEIERENKRRMEGGKGHSGEGHER